MILIFSSDQFAAFVVAFTLGLVLKQLMAGIFIGVGLAWVFRKFRESVPDGYVAHLLYWYTGFPLAGRSVINPFVRRFVG